MRAWHRAALSKRTTPIPIHCPPRPRCARRDSRWVNADCPWVPATTPSTTQRTTWCSRWRPRVAKESVRVTFLGGLGEIGRNCAAIEQDGRIVIVDAGLMFPEPTMYGVDLILPDFRWLIERKDRADAIVLI